tara:strand:- start:35990 stop:36106 length:117 start_codon:yes stop_codon:yes gene_type:complete
MGAELGRGEVLFGTLQKREKKTELIIKGGVKLGIRYLP